MKTAFEDSVRSLRQVSVAWQCFYLLLLTGEITRTSCESIPLNWWTKMLKMSLKNRHKSVCLRTAQMPSSWVVPFKPLCIMLHTYRSGPFSEVAEPFSLQNVNVETHVTTYNDIPFHKASNPRYYLPLLYLTAAWPAAPVAHFLQRDIHIYANMKHSKIHRYIVAIAFLSINGA